MVVGVTVPDGDGRLAPALVWRSMGAGCCGCILGPVCGQRACTAALGRCSDTWRHSQGFFWPLICF